MMPIIFTLVFPQTYAACAHLEHRRRGERENYRGEDIDRGGPSECPPQDPNRQSREHRVAQCHRVPEHLREARETVRRGCVCNMRRP